MSEIEIKHTKARKHGLCNTEEYKIWMNMRSRCNNINRPKYHRYGGRGIRVCERWDDYNNFIFDMGPRPSSEHSIERRNNDGDYCPENCYWATRQEQANNTRTNTFIEYNGKRLTYAQWERELNFPPEIIYQRVKRGWSVEDIINTPPEIHENRVYDRLLTFDGQTLSIQEWSKKTGLKEATIRSRIYKGWSDEKILTSKTNDRGYIKIIYNEKEYTIKSFAIFTGLNENTIRKRLKNGWTSEQIVNTPFGESPV